MPSERARRIATFAADNWFKLSFIALLLIIAYELLQISDNLDSLSLAVSQIKRALR